MKKLKIMLAGVLLLCGCSSNKTLTKHNEQMFDVGFDTVVQLLAYTESDEQYASYQAQLKKEFLYYNALFDRYHTYEGVNNIKTINDQAGIAPVKVDQEIIDLLKQAKEYSELSDNQYDVSFGAVLEIWHNYRTQATEEGILAIPHKADLENAKQHTGWDKVEIDEQKQTVYINDPEASIDLGSAAKGYATEMVARKLSEAGLANAIINAGGNVRIIGEKPDADAWSVGIQLPSNTENASLATVYIDKDKSFVTSGDYQRAYEFDGVMYHHIIDPHTLFPARHMRSVTVVTDDSGIADILSTTLFTLSYEEGIALLTQLQETGLDIEAIWVFDETTGVPEGIDLQQSGTYQLAITDGLKDSVVPH